MTTIRIKRPSMHITFGRELGGVFGCNVQVNLPDVDVPMFMALKAIDSNFDTRPHPSCIIQSDELKKLYEMLKAVYGDKE